MMEPTYATVSAQDAAISLPRRVLRNMAGQDWLISFYLCGLLLAVGLGTGPGREAAARTILTDLSLLAVGIFLSRGDVLKGIAGSTLYRFCITIPVVLSYIQLREILPAVTTKALDLKIYDFDMAVFHYEPSVAWDRFVTPVTTEWFAFFYFGYFFILAIHVLPFLLGAKDSLLLRHFAFGIFIQFCVSHTLYMVVPGWGPYHELKFQHELTGGPFWNLVVETVRAGSAQKDIFPSLHTGAPLFFALFSWVHRKKVPFKYTWPVMAFCVTQIICATMFLRWHYLIDIVAGISLACFSTFAGGAFVRWEERRRESLGVQPVFGDAPLAWAWRKLEGVKNTRPPA